jgi:hypothetical protein
MVDPNRESLMFGKIMIGIGVLVGVYALWRFGTGQPILPGGEKPKPPQAIIK